MTGSALERLSRSRPDADLLRGIVSQLLLADINMKRSIARRTTQSQKYFGCVEYNQLGLIASHGYSALAERQRRGRTCSNTDDGASRRCRCSLALRFHRRTSKAKLGI